MDTPTPQAIYRAEKDKALRERRISHVQLMAEAQEAFKKLLADAAIARKGGRPRSNPGAQPAAKAGAAKPTPVKPASAVKEPSLPKVSAKSAAKAAPRKAAAKGTARSAKTKKTSKPARPAKTAQARPSRARARVASAPRKHAAAKPATRHKATKKR